MSIESRRHQYGTVFGHWQIGELLGASKNGQTAVFHLRHKESSQEESAVKVITLIEEHGNLSEFSPRRKAEYEAELEKRKQHALNEVQIMYALKGYTNIVSYEDRVTEPWTEDNSFGCDLLIRMELLRDLRKIIDTGYIFSEAEIIKIGKDICTALILCHGEKDPIIHRDIKPENIFVNARGDYKLGDFGISRILDECHGTTATTAIGTPEYYAPEQERKGYDERVDIYSLGLVLYELSNRNRRPFMESTYDNGGKANLLRLSGTKFPPPCDASYDFAKVILKACAFKVNARYRTAKELLAALEQLPSHTSSRDSKRVKHQPNRTSQNHETVPSNAPSGHENPFETIPAVPNTEGNSPDRVLDQLSAGSDIDRDLWARANSGDADAQNELGCTCYTGQGVSIDYAEAFRWFQKAAGQGNAFGQQNLAICYEYGNGIEKDMSMARDWYRKAADQGHPGAQYRLGEIYYRGNGVSKAYVQAFMLFQLSAAQGYVAALDRMGDCFYWGNGTEKSYAKAVEWYQKAVDRGNPYAMYSLGFCYKHGQGVAEDKKKAALLFYEAAQKGSSAAQKELDTIDPNESLHLADCLYYGRGVDKNRTKAIPYFLKAAEAGIRYAEYSLGFCYENGQGIKADSSEAFSWYQKAAKHGNVTSMRHLADCYLYGKGVNKDASTAVMWYVKAAESDDAVARRQLGICYANGLGVPMDLLKAMDYFQKAMERSDLEAAIQYNRILTDASKSERAKFSAYGHKLENISEKHAKEIAKEEKARKEEKREDVLFSVCFIAGLAFPLVALIAGCIMWFISIPIGLNITILVTAGIISALLLHPVAGESNKWTEKLTFIGFGAIIVPLATAIVVALLEGVLWAGKWIFSFFS